jgi:hypothetical protein
MLPVSLTDLCDLILPRSTQPEAEGLRLFNVVSNCVAGRWRTLQYIGTRLSAAAESRSTEHGTSHQNSAAEAVLARHICQVAARWKGGQVIEISRDDLDLLSEEERIGVEIAFQHLSLAERYLLLGNEGAAAKHIHNYLKQLWLAASRIGADWDREQELRLNQTATTLAEVLCMQLEVRRMVRFRHMPRRLTFLLGMHRSGTSALAGALCRRGFCGPSDPLPANHGNAMGYFESAGLVAVNDSLLKEFGLEWKSTTALSHGWIRSEVAKKWRRRVVSHLGDTFDPDKHALIKDPRLNTLFVGLSDWLECMDFDVSVILQIRHPYECASSLNKLRNVPIADGLRLWNLHVVSAEHSTRGMERIITTYEELLSTPEQLLERICTRLLLH